MQLAFNQELSKNHLQIVAKGCLKTTVLQFLLGWANLNSKVKVAKLKLKNKLQNYFISELFQIVSDGQPDYGQRGDQRECGGPRLRRSLRRVHRGLLRGGRHPPRHRHPRHPG